MLIDGEKVSFHTDLQNGNCEEMHRGSFGFSAWFLSASSLTGSQWCNVLFDPYFFEARSRYFVFPWRHFSKFLMHSMVDLYSMEPFWYIFANPILKWSWCYMSSAYRRSPCKSRVISLAGFASEGIWRLRRSPAHESREVRRLISESHIHQSKAWCSCILITLCKN